MELTRHRGAIRFVLIYEAVTIGLVSAWILIAPRNFYDEFPTGPSEWVSVLPPYNEHLIRDFGAAGLGLTVLALLAALWMERRVVQAAAVAIFVGSVPHFAYHLTTIGDYDSTADKIFSNGGLFLQTALPLLLLYLASGGRQGAAQSKAGGRQGAPPKAAIPEEA
jgi:hypothetical protein